MIAAVEPRDIERFQSAIARRLGLRFDDAKLGFLAEVLRKRLQANGRVCETYLTRLETEDSRDELSALAREITVPETYFFRNIEQFRAFSEVALPSRMRAQFARKRLHILSAGCASGEEPYSLAILVRECMADPSWTVSLLGIDINPAMLEKAARARYSAWALREMPADVEKRWLRPDGRELLMDETIRASVSFAERNLAEDDLELWQPGLYDVVFCRNTIMYFTQEASEAVIARITRALAPGGYLFLGHSETLRGLSQDFHIRHTHGTFYYQRKDRTGQPAEHWPAGASPPAPFVPAPLAAIVQGTDTWVGAISKAAERIKLLAETQQRPALSGEAGAPAAVGPREDLDRALELLRKERFADALGLIRALPRDSASDPDALLLEAVLLTHSGQLRTAEKACRRLLEVDEFNAGAHYVLALCREGAGDRSGAVEHVHVALYLDPGFAMARLYLGLLTSRSGDREAARRELGQALTLLQREDASRLLLFGGGFGRAALLSLCRAEFLGCEGRP